MRRRKRRLAVERPVVTMHMIDTSKVTVTYSTTADGIVTATARTRRKEATSGLEAQDLRP